MKKLFTLLIFVLFGTMSYAQDTYAFSDKDGNVYEDAATIECSKAEEDDFGTVMVPSGLYVKNVGASGNYKVSMVAEIKKMDNGAVQLCFPVNCATYNTTGKQGETSKGSVNKGEVKNLMTEWLPTAYGECQVVYTMKIYDNIFSKGSKTITVNYKYVDPTGIRQVENVSQREDVYYNFSGQRVSKPSRGLYIVNGRKFMKK